MSARAEFERFPLLQQYWQAQHISGLKVLELQIAKILSQVLCLHNCRSVTYFIFCFSSNGFHCEGWISFYF